MSSRSGNLARTPPSLRAQGKPWDTHLTLSPASLCSSCLAGMPGNTSAPLWGRDDVPCGQRAWTRRKGVCVNDNLITSFFQREKQLYNRVLVHIKWREIASTCCPPGSCAYWLQLPFWFSHTPIKLQVRSFTAEFPLISLNSLAPPKLCEPFRRREHTKRLYVSTSMHHLLAGILPHRRGPSHLRHCSNRLHLSHGGTMERSPDVKENGGQKTGRRPEIHKRSKV